MKTFLISCFFTALVAGQDSPSPTPAPPSPDTKTIIGYSAGDFELLGSLCFLADSQGSISFSWDDETSTISTTDKNGNVKPVNVYLSVYDEDGFDDLFDSKKSKYSETEEECQRRMNVALDSFQLFKGLNSKNLPLGNIFPPNSEDARKATQLFFVIQQCSDQSFLNIKDYEIYANGAVNCDIIRKGENTDRTTASWVAIVILTLTILMMIATTFFFYSRSRQLASVEL